MTDQRLIDELPTLGRPIQLGMLYDCRSDALIPGLTLWDPATIQSHREVSPQTGTQFNIISSDGMDDKASALNVGVPLKASVISGLVEVGGSATFLNDRRSSERQSRLTLHYKTTTRFEQLTMKHFSPDNVQHPNVFEESTATHVVTGILYGDQAFFVFDRDCKSEENIKDVQRNMHDMVNKIPSFEVEGGDGENVDLTGMRCTYHGDFAVENKPSNYKEAVDMYMKLPSLLGSNGENAVPMRAWLYPLVKLDKRSTKLSRRHVHVNLISQSQEIIEGIDQLLVKCNDMVMQDVCTSFPQFPWKFGTLKKMLSDHKLSFQKYLGEALPAIRGGSVEECTLAEAIREQEQSPLSLHQLREWTESKEKEMSVVQVYMKLFDGIQIIRSRKDLDKLILDPLFEYIVCFSFPSIGREEEYLDALSKYLKSRNPTTYRVGKGWFDDISTSRNIRKCAKIFIEFSQANEEGRDTVFVVTCFDEGRTPVSEEGCILLYEQGILATKGFEPPGRPSKPVVTDKSHNEISLEWQPPNCGLSEVQRYQVKYSKMKGNQSRPSDWMEVQTHSNKRNMTIGGLEPFTSYEFQVISVCRAGVSMGSENSDSCTTLPVGPPTQLRKKKGSKSTITIMWEQPDLLGEDLSIERYKIKYKQIEGPSDKCQAMVTIITSNPSCSFTIENLKAAVNYSIWVSAVCRKAGTGTTSEPVELSTGSIAKVEKYAQKLIQKAPLLKKGLNGRPSIYKIPLTEVRTDATYRSFNFGKKSTLTRQHKVIMVVGATGSGKSTLINGMINFILRIQWKDGYRFKIVDEHGEGSKSQAHSQTQCITSYTINKEKIHNIPYTLTIIDTPGFGDTRGIERDKDIIDQIRDFFSHSDVHHVDHIDAIGFVAQASLARLTHPQRYIFDSILSIFGKDISQNILLLVTFADGQKPPVINAVREAEIPCSESIFKFNNSALFASTRTLSAGSTVGERLDSGSDDEGNADFDKMFWQMGERSMHTFFAALDKLDSRSLSLTKEVLEERKRLEVAVEGLQPKIKMGVCKIDELRNEQRILEQHDVEIEANKDFTYYVEIPKCKMVDISGSGNYITNCSKCSFSCHYPCKIADDGEKDKCWAMTDGTCRVCPGNCIWNVHFNQKYKFDFFVEKEKRTYAQLEERYKDATGKKLTAEQVIRRHEEEFLHVQNCVLSLISDSHISLKRLEEIALKPNPLSTVEYVDLLIESETREAQPGWLSRVNALQDIRKMADIMEKLKKGKFDPFEKFKKEVERTKLSKKGRPWYNFWSKS